MGIPPFLVASTLNTTVAQRLVRLICTDCKVRTVMEDSMYPRQYRPPAKVAYHYHGAGCARCHYTGYRGRRAIYEVIPIDQELSAEIKNANMNIQQQLSARGIKTLAENAFELFKSGETSLDEIYPLLLNY
jgi:general secretion pathway protein E/type IV pilus assembly protein PilB